MRTVLVLVLFVASAHAHDFQPLDIGVFADAAGTVQELNVVPGVLFDVYVVAFDPPAPMIAYEFGLDVPAGILLLTFSLIGPAPLNVGPPAPDFIIGTGGCVATESSWTMVAIQALAVQPPLVDSIVGLRGTNPSSFDGEPGYAACLEEGQETNDLFAFVPAPNRCNDRYPDGSLIVNPTFPCTVVSGSESTFGAIKSRF